MEQDDSPETIDFNELIESNQISDQDFFNSYIRETWLALTLQSKNKKKGIEKNIFAKYYELPGILTERLFTVLDKDNDGILGEEEFTKGMLKLFSKGRSLHSLSKFIFKIYDFDKDGKISKEDVRLVLSYIPIYSSDNKEKYEDVVESQNELQKVIKTAFGEKNEIDMETFCDLVKNKSSDIFIHVLMLLLDKRPFSNESIIVYMANKNISHDQASFSTPKLKSEVIPSPRLDVNFASPNLKQKITSQRKKVLSENNVLKFLSFNIDSNEKDNENENDNDNDKEIKKEEEEKTITYEGYVYKMFKDKLKKIYLRLVGKDLYVYKNNEEKKHRGIYNLSAVFAKEGEDVIIKNTKYYTIATIYQEKKKLYYFKDIEVRNVWLEKFKLVTEKKNINDNYEILKDVGKGKFGIVKYGIDKKTQKPVAIKIIPKINMSDADLELSMTEIKILKICQHPYTIKLYDNFETSDYIYFIMEYCEGGSLLNYFKKYNKNLPEKTICEIIHKLSLAVNFIHSFGVVHRDLKPENILMTNDSPTADIRLIDFGLSIIIGPNEKCNVPYGTITYIAPEVLLGKTYDKSVDIWSIGIITFFLLCGYLPFDDNESEKKIAKQITKMPTPFDNKVWDNISPEAKDFVDKILQKEPENRLNMDQILDHPWIKKFSQVSDLRLNNINKENDLNSNSISNDN